MEGCIGKRAILDTQFVPNSIPTEPINGIEYNRILKQVRISIELFFPISSDLLVYGGLLGLAFVMNSRLASSVVTLSDLQFMMQIHEVTMPRKESTLNATQSDRH